MQSSKLKGQGTPPPPSADAVLAMAKRGSEVSDPFVSLPDSILKHIISLLPFKDAARTPSISRTWLRVWPCSPKIVLDERPFLQSGTLADRYAFILHARRFASRYDQPKVHSFLLRFSRPLFRTFEVLHWISLATRASAENITLDFSDPNGRDLGPNAFPFSASEVGKLSHCLRSLRLSGCQVSTYTFRAFTNLRVLSIERTALLGVSVHVLMESCVCLEDLTLANLTDLEVIDIVDHTERLLRLTIDECMPVNMGVDIRAPNLKYFKYSGCMTPFDFEMPAVEEVVLDFGLEFEYVEYGDLLCTILDSLCHTRVLTVCSYITQVIPSGEEPFSLPAPIGYLKHLILKTELHQNELPGIALLLRGYEQLESVTFEMIGERTILQDYEYPFTDVYDGSCFWERQFLFICCLKHHLKRVKIVGFEGKTNEVAILDFLLQRSNVLEEVIINVSKKSPGDLDKYYAAAWNLPFWKKASKHVTIKIF